MADNKCDAADFDLQIEQAFVIGNLVTFLKAKRFQELFSLRRHLVSIRTILNYILLYTRSICSQISFIVIENGMALLTPFYQPGLSPAGIELCWPVAWHG
ncbi:hypothetical protein DPMN_116659 [Dreissena polymorpha]|uniref:Uncharacterized protein n=1 Tax=Dreissena polymorpha TaxID=45954 RepID=A0A9D4QTL5_DREPO|nr:hypothetical protein DPMN_116659 [Dreissena polymorpha]